MNQSKAFAALAFAVALAGPVGAAQEGGYDQARWDAIHFKQAIDEATDAQCLACHEEVLTDRVRETSPAGVAAADTLAWYQTLNTYAGVQETFHRRHLTTDFAKQVMDLKCNTCHQGNDPRDETANSSADGQTSLVQRKQVDPTICLMCHGQFNKAVMGMPGGWAESGHLFGDDCLTCHTAIRTHRHQVNFLKPEVIEAAGAQDSDACYGCHGGRAWYRISYPYPRHAWPGSGSKAPQWAKDRPTRSDPRFTDTADTATAQ